ncbi:MAG: HD domain-containing protein [Lachnospiraceae bacterium]|nr:HD domain-containing protein [Lachnospiraceae bacterium]
MKKTNQLRKIRKAVEKIQDARRFEHTLGVEYTAAALAMRYGSNMENARTAGLLHDCAKCLSDEKRLSICKKNHIKVTEVERKNPFLLHAKVGAYLAREKYGIKDPDILNAIQNHTTGRKNMSLLEKIIFVADYIEPGRKHAPNLAEVRKLAFMDIDRALLMILRDTLQYLKASGGDIDPMTEETWRYYSQQ